MSEKTDNLENVNKELEKSIRKKMLEKKIREKNEKIKLREKKIRKHRWTMLEQ